MIKSVINEFIKQTLDDTKLLKYHHFWGHNGISVDFEFSLGSWVDIVYTEDSMNIHILRDWHKGQPNLELGDISYSDPEIFNKFEALIKHMIDDPKHYERLLNDC